MYANILQTLTVAVATIGKKLKYMRDVNYQLGLLCSTPNLAENQNIIDGQRIAV